MSVATGQLKGVLCTVGGGKFLNQLSLSQCKYENSNNMIINNIIYYSYKHNYVYSLLILNTVIYESLPWFLC